MAVDLKMQVLVVDDYATMTRIIRGFLDQMGFSNVEEAPDGEAALDKLRHGRFGLVISDWNMHRMSGIELLREVRSSPDLKGIPFIMVTADATYSNMVVAHEAGVSSFMLKPFTAETLHEKMTAVLGTF